MSARQSQATWALLAAVAGLVLIASMFLDWYRVELPEGIPNPEVDLPTFTGFEALERADVALVVAAGVGIVVAGLVVAGLVASSPAPGIVLVAAGLFALAVVLYRGVISPPGLAFLGVDLDMEVRFGWFVGLVAAVAMLVGGILTYLGGPRLEFATDEEASPPEERSADGARRPLS